MTNRYRKSAGLAVPAVLPVLAVLATIGLAACGGSSGPKVASLGKSSGDSPGATTTTLPKGNPTQLLDEWASCMRSNGTPGVADPTIDANGTIHITLPANSNSGPDVGPNNGGPCSAYLEAASNGLRGGQPAQKPDPAKLLDYSRCMQAHGIPDFPDPTSTGLSVHITPGSDLNPNNPTFQAASTLCSKKTGVPGFGSKTGQRGGIDVTSGSGPDGRPGGGGSSSSGLATGGGGGDAGTSGTAGSGPTGGSGG